MMKKINVFLILLVALLCILYLPASAAIGDIQAELHGEGWDTDYIMWPSSAQALFERCSTEMVYRGSGACKLNAAGLKDGSLTRLLTNAPDSRYAAYLEVWIAGAQQDEIVPCAVYESGKTAYPAFETETQGNWVRFSALFIPQNGENLQYVGMEYRKGAAEAVYFDDFVVRSAPVKLISYGIEAEQGQPVDLQKVHVLGADALGNTERIAYSRLWQWSTENAGDQLKANVLYSGLGQTQVNLSYLGATTKVKVCYQPPDIETEPNQLTGIVQLKNNTAFARDVTILDLYYDGGMLKLVYPQQLLLQPGETRQAVLEEQDMPPWYHQVSRQIIVLP